MAVKLGYVTPEEFDEWVVPEDMVGKYFDYTSCPEQLNRFVSN